MAVLVPMMNDQSAQDEVSCVQNNLPCIFGARAVYYLANSSWSGEFLELNSIRLF